MSLRNFPECVDGLDEGLCPVGRREKNFAAFRFFGNESGFMKSFHMFHRCGLLDPAQSRNFVDAEGWVPDQQPHDFNTTVV